MKKLLCYVSYNNTSASSFLVTYVQSKTMKSLPSLPTLHIHKGLSCKLVCTVYIHCQQWFCFAFIQKHHWSHLWIGRAGTLFMVLNFTLYMSATKLYNKIYYDFNIFLYEYFSHTSKSLKTVQQNLL